VSAVINPKPEWHAAGVDVHFETDWRGACYSVSQDGLVIHRYRGDGASDRAIAFADRLAGECVTTREG